MPIIVKEFKWKQTPTHINITVPIPLKNAHESKVDIFISSRFVKASYEQYHFEAVLYAPIEKVTSRCTLTNKDIVFELKKWEDGEWEYLEPNVSKKEKLEMKKQFLEESFKEIQEYDKKISDRKHELKRVAVRKQIIIDSESRKYIDDKRKMEEKKALGDLEEFKKKVGKKLKQSQRKAIKAPPTNTSKEPAKPPPEVPKTRTTATVHIDFTHRELPTPSRESKLEEEHEYLAKQAEARRTVGFVSEDIRPEERNPHFIKAKGDEFLKNKNYLGAISAYSYGIKLSKNFVDLYIARSEAQMGQQNYWRAASDCSTALELLNPICEANLYERALCTGRRGEALCNLNMKREGITELEYSLKLIDQKYYREVLEREKKLHEEQLLKEKEEKEKRLQEEEERKRKKLEKEEEEKRKKAESDKQKKDDEIQKEKNEEQGQSKEEREMHQNNLKDEVKEVEQEQIGDQEEKIHQTDLIEEVKAIEQKQMEHQEEEKMHRNDFKEEVKTIEQKHVAEKIHENILKEEVKDVEQKQREDQEEEKMYRNDLKEEVKNVEQEQIVDQEEKIHQTDLIEEVKAIEQKHIEYEEEDEMYKMHRNDLKEGVKAVEQKQIGHQEAEKIHENNLKEEVKDVEQKQIEHQEEEKMHRNDLKEVKEQEEGQQQQTQIRNITF